MKLLPHVEPEGVWSILLDLAKEINTDDTDVHLSCNGVHVLRGVDLNRCIINTFETIACTSEADWRLVFINAHDIVTYQRQKARFWVCVEFNRL